MTSAVRSRAVAALLALSAIISVVMSAAAARMVLSDPQAVVAVVTQTDASMLRSLAVVVLAIVDSLLRAVGL